MKQNQKWENINSGNYNGEDKDINDNWCKIQYCEVQDILNNDAN